MSYSCRIVAFVGFHTNNCIVQQSPCKLGAKYPVPNTCNQFLECISSQGRKGVSLKRRRCATGVYDHEGERCLNVNNPQVRDRICNAPNRLLCRNTLVSTAATKTTSSGNQKNSQTTRGTEKTRPTTTVNTSNGKGENLKTTWGPKKTKMPTTTVNTSNGKGQDVETTREPNETTRKNLADGTRELL